MSAQAPVPVPGDTPVDELTFTEASRELDGIVEFFERQEVDVDQLVARLERATAIVDELDRRIKGTRAQVEELVPRLEAAARGEGAGTRTAAPLDEVEEYDESAEDADHDDDEDEDEDEDELAGEFDEDDAGEDGQGEQSMF
ncbi:MAG TPA: exodeoxyribonuclease VII small subunit [Acidimicrobiales bacterium]|nr:exodeoxyribonuclease VII small subunit [Acidimicrobiales bacterium]